MRRQGGGGRRSWCCCVRDVQGKLGQSHEVAWVCSRGSQSPAYTPCVGGTEGEGRVLDAIAVWWRRTQNLSETKLRSCESSEAERAKESGEGQGRAKKESDWGLGRREAEARPWQDHAKERLKHGLSSWHIQYIWDAAAWLCSCYMILPPAWRSHLLEYLTWLAALVGSSPYIANMAQCDIGFLCGGCSSCVKLLYMHN